MTQPFLARRAFLARLGVGLSGLLALLVGCEADVGPPPSRGDATYDSSPDPDVSRVLIPNIRDVPLQGALVSSNAFGMRERDYDLPKPDDVLRLVMLGDSYVFGLGAAAEDRFGVLLERELEQRAGWTSGKRIEVLHIAIGSWNTKAECAYVLRHLSRLDPDLVVQMLIGNDLDDNTGVRGFGSRSRFDPAHPYQGNGQVFLGFPMNEHGSPGVNPIMRDLDWESRHRFDEAVAWVARLDQALEERGCPYLFYSTVGQTNGHTILRRFGPIFGEERLIFTDSVFKNDPAYRISDTDGHWNATGNRRVAELLYGCLTARNVLPELALAAWETADATYAELHLASRERIDTSAHPSFMRRTALEDPRQIYGGIYKDYRVAPYASVSLTP
ncbi:MAG: SGNH/GDSL hydrolase family protein, partial [Planctomycetota bacterium]